MTREQQLIRESREVAQPIVVPSPAAEVIDRETTLIEERAVPAVPPPPARIAPPPQLIAQPAPQPIEIPRETIIEHDHETTTRIEETSEGPVLLQPIVLDQTRTIIEPARERETIIETRTEETHHDQRTIPRTIENEREALRTIVEPRTTEIAIAQQQPAFEGKEEERRPEAERVAAETEEEEAPRTVVEPRIVELERKEDAQAELQPQRPDLQIHIGTIEIRAAAPPPPPAPAPPPAILPRAPEPPSNFDDYAAVRNYIFPDVWR